MITKSNFESWQLFLSGFIDKTVPDFLGAFSSARQKNKIQVFSQHTATVFADTVSYHMCCTGTHNYFLAHTEQQSFSSVSNLSGHIFC